MRFRSENWRFSLQILLLGMLMLMVLMALWAPIIRHIQEKGVGTELVVASVFGSGSGLVLGIYFGLSHYRRFVALVWSIPLGFVVGGLLSSLMVVDADMLSIFFLSSIACGFLLIAVSLWLSKRWYRGRLAALEGSDPSVQQNDD